jgi:RNA polymerase sigma factor (sigma-70 family)
MLELQSNETSMMRSSTMSDFLANIQATDSSFEQQLVQQYSARLIGLASRQMPDRVRRRLDPEDVVQSVYRSFFRRLNDGCFSFDESHDVWRLLAAMTFHKARNAVKYHQRTRRDVRRDVSLQSEDESSTEEGIDANPGAEDINVLFGCLDQLLGGLPENHREIVVQRLEGKTIDQIARAVKRSRRTVMRILAGLRNLAAKQLESAG